MEKFLSNPRHVEIQFLGDEPGCLLAVAEVGIAEVEITLRYAVEREQQLLRTFVAAPVLPDAVGERHDVFRVVVVVVDETQVGQPAPGLQDIGHFVEHRGRGRRRVLRVQRQKTLLDFFLHGLRLFLGRRDQRRAFQAPDLFVGSC